MTSQIDDLTGPQWARQHLNGSTGVLETVEWLGGMNAQTARGPGVGLWARIEGFDHRDLDELLRSHQLVKASLMRGTVHLVAARQYLAWREALQPALERTFKQFCPRLWDTVDRDDLLAAGIDMLRREPGDAGLTRGEIDEALRPRFPKAPEGQLGFALRLLAPVVQVPDQTAWRPGRTRYVLAESVMPGDFTPADEGLTDLLTAYLRIHGPATAADAAYYTGITGLGAALRTVGSVVGGTSRTPVFDLPEPPNPTDVPPVVVLPEYDSVWFGHKDGGCRAARKQLIPNTAVDMLGSIVLDDQLVRAWKPRRDTVELVDGPKLTRPGAEAFDAFRTWYENTSEETNR